MTKILPMVVILVFLGADAAWAQSTPEERAAQISSQGLEAVDAGDFIGAVGLFKKAYRIDPKAKYLYNVGRAYHIMGKFRLALEYYEKFLAENTSAMKAKRAQETVSEVKRQLATLVLHVDVAGTVVEVDGDDTVCEIGKPCLLDPGEHRIEVTATGYASQQRRLRVDAGETRVESITMVAVLMEELPTRKGAVWRSSLFPGMGQMYAGNKTAGIVFLTSEILALATMTTGIILEQYYTGQRDADKPEYFKTWNPSIDASYYTWIGGLAAAGTIWAVNIVHAAAMRLPTAGDANVSVLPFHNGLSLMVSF